MLPCNNLPLYFSIAYFATVGLLWSEPRWYFVDMNLFCELEQWPAQGCFCLKKGEKGGEKLTKKAGSGLFVALMLFVGIPLPGTGAWTGTLAASILDLDFKKTIMAVLCGVLMAGIIMMILALGFGIIL